MTGEVYRDGAGEFRWRIRSENGNIVAVSGEGYKRKWYCKRAMKKLLK